MNLKKIISLLVVLMLLAPTFAFAAEVDSANSSNFYEPSSSIDSQNFNVNEFESNENLNVENIYNEPDPQAFVMQTASQMSVSQEESLFHSISPQINYNVSSISSLNYSLESDFDLLKDNYTTDLFTGAAIYRYPIKVPNGVGNFTPNIELIYNSQSVGGIYGWLGDGWAINENYIVRDINFTRYDVSDDKFQLVYDHQTYNLIYNEKDGFYHTEFEGYMYIQKESGAFNQKGEYWILKFKNGTECRFGYTEDSEIPNSNSDVDYIHKWKLDQMEDANGNLINYFYVTNPRNGEIGASYLDKIIYNNESILIQFNRILRTSAAFNYYFYGNQISEAFLLSSIEIRDLSQNHIVYQHNLEYDTSNYHVLLHSITFSKDNSNLPPTIFSYNNGKINFIRQDFPGIPYAKYNSSSTYYNRPYKLMDVNGDGLTDIVDSFYYTYDKSTGKNVWLNDGTKFTLTSNFRNVPIFTRDDNDTNYKIGDFNGDGLPDVYTNSELWINNGTDFNKDSKISLPPYRDFLFMDINGDGLSDLVYLGRYSSNSEVWISNGTGFNLDSSFINIPQSPVHAVNTSSQVVDVNGDGLLDITFYYHLDYWSKADGTVNHYVREYWRNNGGGFDLYRTNNLAQRDVANDSTYIYMDLDGDCYPEKFQSYFYNYNGTPECHYSCKNKIEIFQDNNLHLNPCICR